MDESRLTLEDLGRRGLKLYQLRDGFRFGTDTVLLSWFTSSFLKEGRAYRLLELGANCGAASLLAFGRRPDVHIDALEIDEEACEVLLKNIELNGIEESIKAYNGDVRALPDNIRRQQYDLVLMNPPFFRIGTGPMSDETRQGKLKGRFEKNGSLEDFISAGASRLIPSSGLMTVVMAASRADEVLLLMDRYGVKPGYIMSVHPFVDSKAEVVLICGRKTATDPKLEILPPLILNEMEDGKSRTSSRLLDIYDKEQTDCFI
ncbi:MAG: methyltransferase [Clostridiales bacterium]|nr:methyltransferase [Clostridiales bacterium]